MHSGGVASWFADLGGEHTFAYAINNNGKVAGYAEDVNGTNHPVTWTDGVLTELPLLPSSQPGWGGGGRHKGSMIIEGSWDSHPQRMGRTCRSMGGRKGQ